MDRAPPRRDRIVCGAEEFQRTKPPAPQPQSGAQMALKFNVGPLPRLLILVLAVVAVTVQVLGAYGWSKSFSIPCALFCCLQLQKLGIL